MYSTEVIHQIHESLQALGPSALVLLGGSYLYGEAGEESDVDFYLICPVWQLFFLKKLKKKIKKLKQEFPEIDFSVMIVPWWLRRYGYYLYGKDTAGKIHTWAVPKQVLIRNCVKLAFYNYLRSQVEDKAKERNLAKTKKQLAVAYMANAGKIDFNEPIFSQKYIQSHAVIPTGAEGGVEESLDHAATKFFSYFSSSLSNYLLYNIRFLFRGNPLFLFKNPDKMIIERLKTGFDKREDVAQLYKEIKEIIFPVIIF